jgi:hypothetical protein
MGRRLAVRPVPVLTFLLLTSLILADEPLDDKAKAVASFERAKREASALSIRVGNPESEPLVMVPEPVLKWSNPIQGTLYGDVFIWTHKGRPEVVGSFLEWYAPIQSRELELHSLSLGPLVAKRDNGEAWAPTRPGVELKSIPGAAAPGASAAQRLRQMRELAKEFTARQVTHAGDHRDLRLLNQPIYRYKQTEADLVDGALFVFVLATDPETFLQIEARQVNGALQWQYALARFNSTALSVSHNGREVWTAPQIVPFERVLVLRQPYTAIMLGRTQ